MDGFEYKQGDLYADDLLIADLADQIGTPFFVYSAQGIRSNFRRLQSAFGQRQHQIHYAVKANPNLGLLACLSKLGAGFDVVSGGELTRALKVSNPEDIVFSGVGKSEEEIRLALEHNISSINIESAAELKRIQTIAQSMNKSATVAVRVNPDVDAKTHEYISTGLKENKFGVDTETAIGLYQQIQSLPNIKAPSIAYHIGSQIMQLGPMIDAINKVLVLVDQLLELGIVIKHLDLGGGLGIRYQDENPPLFEDYVQALVSTVDKQHPHLHISIEPGRSIVGNTGLLISKVEYLKNNSGKHFAIVDAAMNDLIRPALYKAWMNICEVQQNDSKSRRDYDVVGPICESADFLGKNRSLAIEQGDLIAVQSTGAYCSSMASNYNSRPRPAEVLVDGDKFHIIRQRESYNDLFDREIIPEFSAS